MIVNGLENNKLIPLMAEKLQKEFLSPFKVQSNLITVEVSIGVSVFLDQNTDAHTLIQLADEAMYQAKKQSGTSIYYI